MTRVVHLGDRAVPVWPDGQSFDTLDGVLHSTLFTDVDLYHPRLKQFIVEQVQQASGTKRYARSMGGTKVHHPDQWGCAEATLLHERVLEFFRRAFKCDTAVADLAWANVYRDGDYCLPHSHYRATASLVYFLEPGDADDLDPDAGRLGIWDPRFARCCAYEDGCLTTPIYADMTPGSLVMFPGSAVHAVNPYRGIQPRITLSWNVNKNAMEGSAFPPGVEMVSRDA